MYYVEDVKPQKRSWVAVILMGFTILRKIPDPVKIRVWLFFKKNSHPGVSKSIVSDLIQLHMSNCSSVFEAAVI